MTTITIKNVENLTKTEFEDLDDLRAYLSSREIEDKRSAPLSEFTSEQLGQLWDQGINSGEPITFDSNKEQDFLKQLEDKFRR